MPKEGNAPSLDLADKNSRDFIESWLPSRLGLLKKNVQTYNKLATGDSPDITDDVVSGVLFSQLTNMRSTQVSSSNTLPTGVNGKYDRNGYMISIDDKLVNSKNITELENYTTHERAHSLRPIPQEAAVKSYMSGIRQDDHYLDKPSEIYARLMSARKSLGISPSKVVTEDDLKQWTGPLKDFDLHRYPKSVLLNLFNGVANNTNTKKVGGLLCQSNLA